MPLRTLRLALVLPILLAVVLGAPAPRAAAAPSGPSFAVAERELAAALSCPRSLAGVTRAPVLLVPGSFLEPRANYDWNYEPALDAAGIPWCALAVPRYASGDIQDTAEYVVYALRRMHEESGRRVSVVGFSQGGMVGRWALRWWPDTRPIVEDLIGLAPTNHGTLSGGATCVAPCPTAGRQQLDRARFIAALNEPAETFAGIDYTVAYTRFDEVATPNSAAATATSPLRTGDGRVRNVQVQEICPLHIADHLALGSYDPVGWALVIDALTHDGPADPARISRAVCARLFMPGVDPVAFPANYARYLATIATGLLSGDQVTAEPPLRCYVTATCAAAAAPAPPSRCAGRDRVTLRLDRGLRRARVTVDGRPVRVRRRHGRLVAVIDLRRRSGVVTVRIRGVTRAGRSVSRVRRYRGCAAPAGRTS
ncbi:MAG: hypothetical protein QOD24_1239 [Solirubrobacteraceae bacterium]|nr:hypothetical protein [Solirubrobacteraceae bacterium]